MDKLKSDVNLSIPLKGDGKGIVEITNIGFEPLLTDEEYEISTNKQLKNWESKRLEKNIDILYKICDYKNSNEEMILEIIYEFEDEIKLIKTEINELNSKLKEFLKKNILITREIHTDRKWMYKDQYRIISLFEGSLERAFKCYDREYTYKIVSAVTYYTEIFDSIEHNGFIFNGEKYIFYTAGAGQTRCKKSTFVKEKDFLANRDKLFCGLSEDIINANGGMNTNKYLAYTSLTQSNSEIWREFDIDRAIVVDDIEFMLPKQKVRHIIVETPESRERVNQLKKELEKLKDNCVLRKKDLSNAKKLINDEIKTIKSRYYTIEEVFMDILIPFTDGFGIILYYEDTSMARLPFVKGLMSYAPYEEFKEKYKIGYGEIEVVDIYGEKWNIDKDNIKYIFTKSQFKMWKYYKDWNDYKEKFKKYECEACRCNVERKVKLDASTNYQILQTLTTEMTDEDIISLADQDIYDLEHIGDNYKSMLNILGANDKVLHPTFLQKSLMIYPEMLKDKYIKNTLCDKKNSIIKDMRSGKFSINGTYTFIIPDVLACMQWWFLEKRKLGELGVLSEGEVSCNLFKNGEEVGCLRSPHLDHAHCVRKNKVSPNTKKWFKTKGLYVGVKDIMSKLLMYDNDGDKSLVHNSAIINNCAKQFQNKYGMIPNYYEMAKAKSENINKDTLFEGIIKAYHHGNIGLPSNDITGIWSKLDLNSSEKEIKKAIECIAIKTAIVNFTIDFAKTLWMSEVPKHISKQLSQYGTKKTPFFFQFAKDKERKQCEPKRQGCIDRIYDIVPDKKIKFKNLLGRYSYTNLMSYDVDINTDIAKSLFELYMEIHTSKKIRYLKDNEESFDDKNIEGKHKVSQFEMLNYKIKKELLSVIDDEDYIVNVLVKSLKNEVSKSTLWDVFGERLYQNVLNNIGDGIVTGKEKFCEVCGERFEVKTNNMIYCEKCAKEKIRERDRNRKK